MQEKEKYYNKIKNTIGQKLKEVFYEELCYKDGKGITVIWDKITNEKFPQSWEIKFGNSQVKISALEIVNDKVVLAADHLSIFFTD